MYLRALEIQGFKSFPEKTRLTFEKNITAIVGPNGSGKSNLADAVLWVMGEQRSKALRGAKMEDVIFGGTEKRSPLGFAQVSLILDNSGHLLDSDSTEIMLTRRYYRSGESEYFINREMVRLKDIHSLLMDTGLGRDGYSIIGQGRIADIVSTKATDRREVFEEAAGISRFRYRKEEAGRKLEKTEENLLRINDKIEELELQVGPLREQAAVAKKYLALRDELKIKEISAWMSTLDKLRQQAAGVNLEYDQAARSLEKAKSELEALYASSGSFTERMHQKDVESEQARERLSLAEAAAAERDSAAAVLRANVASGEASRERLLQDISEQESRAGEIRAGIGDGEKRLGEIEQELLALADQTRQNNNVLEGCRLKLKNREDMVRQLAEKANSLTVELRSVEGRIRMLSEMEKEYEGYSRAVKTVMREAERGNLKGVHGPVANLLRADEECALAIETALGAAAQNIVIDSQNDGRFAIEMLKRMDAGRATFLPLDTIRGSVMKDAPERDPGFVGVAYDLVSFEPEVEQIVANLLGRTVVAESLADAVRMSKNSQNRLRIVTLDGQMIHAGGSMTGGSSAKTSGILSRANELKKLQKQQETLAENEKKCGDELERARSKQAAVRYQLDMALEDQAELRSHTASFEAEKRTTENSVHQLQLLLESLSGDSDARHRAVEAAQRQIDAFRAELAEKEKQQEEDQRKIKIIREEIAGIAQSKLELEGRRTRADREAQNRNAEILDLERQTARIEQRKLAADMEEKQILDRLWDNYELSHTAAEALREPVESLTKANRQIGELRRDIGALGTPNLGAIDEYERVNTRYEF